MTTKTYTHLIISGGGIKGIAIVGALNVLYNEKVIENDKLEAMVGSSVGGLISLFLNVGYRVEELYEILLKIDFSKYRDIKFMNLMKNFGLDDCSKLMKLVTIMIKQKKFNPDITFLELYEKTKKILVLTGSDVLHNEVKYYSYLDTPAMKVLDALRITISVPGVFFPIKSETNIMVDGALYSPYPVKYFRDVDKEKIIGIMLHNRQSLKKIESFEDYLYSIIISLQARYEKTFIEGYEDATIIIDICEVHSMEFEIGEEKKKLMYQRGQDRAREFIEKIKKKSGRTE